MPLVTDFEDTLRSAPCLITSEAFKYSLQSWLVEVDQHGHIVDLPLNEITAVKAPGVSESQLQLLRNLLRDMGLDVRHYWLVIASNGKRGGSGRVGVDIVGACVANDATNVGCIRIRAVTAATCTDTKPVITAWLGRVDDNVVPLSC